MVDGRMAEGMASAPKFSYASDEVSPVSQRLIRTIEKVSGQPRIKRLYENYTKLGRPPEMFWEDAVRTLRLQLELNKTPAAALPPSGPVVVIANHPFGVIDGIVLCWLVSQVRSDYKIMTHRILYQAPEVQNFVLPVDFTGTRDAKTNNLESRSKARKMLEDGGVVIVFPGGGVAFARDWRGKAVELEWKSLAATLALSTGADVLPVFFSGQNSRLFQVGAKIHQVLKYSLLFHEVRNKIGATITVTLGKAIPNGELRAMGDCRTITKFLHQTTHGMAPPKASLTPRRRSKQRRAASRA
jgi:putative hemolysin